MCIGVLWAGLRVAMWITHVGGKFRHGLLENSLIHCCDNFHLGYTNIVLESGMNSAILDGLMVIIQPDRAAAQVFLLLS